MPSVVTQGLVERLYQRDAAGLAKYGVSLDRRDLTIEQWLDHQTEELLDGAGYAQAAKREIVELRAQVERLRNALEILLEWVSPDAQMEFDDGNISVMDFIVQVLVLKSSCKLNSSQSPAPINATSTASS